MGQIGVALHLFEPARGAGELRGEALPRVEVRGRGIGGHDELDTPVIEGVHEQDETLGPVVVAIIQARDIPDEDGVMA